MIIEVQVKTGSRIDSFEKIGEPNIYSARVRALAVAGDANKAVYELISQHFHVGRNAVTLKHGQRSKIKLFDIITTQQ
jgi:uncharacterized protein YggU (UPF0235/DUF167 family)